jgi:hypothetical protein
LGFGLPLRKYMHLPTFIVANVIVDLEPFSVIVLGFIDRYPLHGYLHTYISVFFLGIVVSYVMFLLEGFFHPLYKTLLFESDINRNRVSFILAGVLGIMLHVTLDSPLYSDIRPLYPMTANPLYNPTLTSEVYSFCVWIGLVGILFYAGLLIHSVYRRFRKK